MITTRTYNTTPGGHVLFHPSLHAVKILSVDRSGLGEDETNVLFGVTNTQFAYFGYKLYFDPLIPFNPGEKVQVIYEK